MVSRRPLLILPLLACAGYLVLHELRVTVIATGFDHGRARPRSAREEARVSRRDRDVRMDDRQRSSLEISDDEIDIPPFLRDR